MKRYTEKLILVEKEIDNIELTRNITGSSLTDFYENFRD
jgi:hypothetical protein